jgi:transcriptional regulator with XRE-family HTH domain
LTQEGLAERAGLSYKFLGEVERGAGNPTLETLQRISDALGVEIVELFPSSASQHPSPAYTISEADFQVMREALESLGELVADVDTTYRRRRSRKRKTRP